MKILKNIGIAVLIAIGIGLSILGVWTPNEKLEQKKFEQDLEDLRNSPPYFIHWDDEKKAVMKNDLIMDESLETGMSFEERKKWADCVIWYTEKEYPDSINQIDFVYAMTKYADICAGKSPRKLK